MFTGLIEEIGKISQVKKMPEGNRISVLAKKIIPDISINDSISINGVCLTVVNFDKNSFTVEAVGETLDKTTLSMFAKNTMVNLERALTLQSRLGGHLVQGHVNGIGMVSKWISRGKNYFLEIEVPQDLFVYCIQEGSIAIDGISLTIAKLLSSSIGINVIPHTVNNTTLHYLKIGKKVNIEVDVMARYVQKFIQHSNKSGINQHKLNEWGY